MIANDRDPIRILAVDDHPLMRAGIGALVSSQADMVVVAEPRTEPTRFTSFASIGPM